MANIHFLGGGDPVADHDEVLGAQPGEFVVDPGMNPGHNQLVLGGAPSQEPNNPTAMNAAPAPTPAHQHLQDTLTPLLKSFGGHFPSG